MATRHSFAGSACPVARSLDLVEMTHLDHLLEPELGCARCEPPVHPGNVSSGPPG